MNYVKLWISLAVTVCASLILAAEPDPKILGTFRAECAAKAAAADQAGTMTVNDKLALVTAAQKKFAAQSALAQAKLKEAEVLLSKLKKADRVRLAKLAAAQERHVAWIQTPEEPWRPLPVSRRQSLIVR